MDNHYHLILETPEGNLSRGMRQLNGIYTQKHNWKHLKTGHVFQGRYKAILVDKENYLLELCRYVVLNPVRANIVKRPQDWKWSSYRSTTGTAKASQWLTTDWILAQFSRSRRRAQRLYHQFIMEGITKETPWKDLKGQIFLGDKGFIEECKSNLDVSSGRPPAYRDMPEDLCLPNFCMRRYGETRSGEIGLSIMHMLNMAIP
jgi:hypothetical protein